MVPGMAAVSNFEDLIGNAPDRLDLATREATVGMVIAMQIYSPANLALQRIQAIGDTVQECVAQLKDQGLDPLDYEFSRLNPPFLAR